MKKKIIESNRYNFTWGTWGTDSFFCWMQRVVSGIYGRVHYGLLGSDGMWNK